MATNPADRAHAIVRSQGGANAGNTWDESKHPRVPGGGEHGGEFASKNFGPNTFALDRAKTLPHYTNGTQFLLSTKKMRLIPNSGSLGAGGVIFGSNRIDVTLKPGTRVLDLTWKLWNNYWSAHAKPPFNDTPAQMGRLIYADAKAAGIQVIRIAGTVHGLGTEWAVLDMNAVASQVAR